MILKNHFLRVEHFATDLHLQANGRSAHGQQFTKQLREHNNPLIARVSLVKGTSLRSLQQYRLSYGGLLMTETSRQSDTSLSHGELRPKS